MSRTYESGDSDSRLIDLSGEYKKEPFMYELKIETEKGKWAIFGSYETCELAEAAAAEAVGRNVGEGEAKISNWAVFNHRGEMVSSLISQRMKGVSGGGWGLTTDEINKGGQE